MIEGGRVRQLACVLRRLRMSAASLGSNYAKVDALLGRWIWLAMPRLGNELRLQFGRDFQYEQAVAPLPEEPAVGPGGFAPEIAIGPNGFRFGSSPSLGRKAYPDENKVQLVDLVTWTRGRHQLQVGVDLSLVHDEIDALTNTQGAFHYDSSTTSGHAGGIVDWITDYTFNVNVNPNGGCPSIVAPVHDFCFRSFTQSFGQQSVTFNTQEWAGFLQDNWRVRPGLTVNAGLRYEYEFLPLPQQPNAALDAAFGKTGATSVFPEDRNNFGPRVGVVVGAVRAGAGCCSDRVWTFLWTAAGRDREKRAGGYGARLVGQACVNYTHDGYKLSAGGKPGFWLCVRLSDGTTISGYDDDLGDGV